MAAHHQDDLAQRLAQQETRITQLQKRLARQERRRLIPRRALPLLLAAFLVVLVPLATLAAFDDTASSPHKTDIDLIAAVGITKGCTTTTYCPTQAVTREQMASYLARTAGLGSNPPVVNAKTVQGYAPDGLVRVARAQSGATTALTTTTVTYGTPLTITAPAAGFVLVTAGYTIAYGSGTPGQVIANIRHIETGNVSERGQAQVSATNIRSSIALTYAFPVSAGANSFDLRTSLFSDSGANGYYLNMTALYVPFGSTGGSTMDLEPAPSNPPKP